MRLFGIRYDNSQAVQVQVDAGRVVRIDAPLKDRTPRADSFAYVAPGFVDIQVNGYGGQEFSSLALTPEKVAEIVRAHFAFGVTSICPTLTTSSFPVLAHGVRTIATACRQFPDVSRAVVGIHLEGPYISAEDGPRGAHPAEHCRAPDWDEFCRLQDAAEGRIAIVTLSPEYEGAAMFISRAVAQGILVAIGHTSADSSQIRAAVESGARLSTHLGNGAHRTLRRHPNYIWDQLAEDRLAASLIVDGHHLPPEVVKTFVRAKSPQRIVLVSDASGMAGLAPGRYTTSGCELEILADGRLVIAGQDQLLAGASAPIGVGVINCLRFAELELATAIELATANPARLLGRECGELRPGGRADFVLFDLDESEPSRPSLRVVATILGGEWVFGRSPEIV